jgi:apolipoprotein N-acyltransferase
MNMWSRNSFGAVAALASGVLFMLSRDTAPFGPLVLVAPVPILLFALSAERGRMVAAWSLVTGALAHLSMLYSYATVLPAVVLALWLSTFALWFMGIVLLTRWIARRSTITTALLSYPLLTTATEFLFSIVSPHGSFGALGYAVAGILPLLQLASLGGVAALTFVAAFIPMAAVMLVLFPRAWRKLALSAGIPVLIIVGFGWLQLMQPYSAERSVALVAIDALQEDEVSSEQVATATATAYADVVDELARAKPDVILLPEKSLMRKAGWGDTGAPLQGIADRSGVAIVAGFITVSPDGSLGNQADVIRPHQAAAHYLKRRLIPGLEEEFAPGRDSLILGDLGVAICKDMDFAPMIRDYGQNGVRLMLVPAWDFKSDAVLHARMAQVRGVENGFAVVRAAADGILTVSDAYGRVTAESATSRDHPVTLTARIGLTDRGTVYSRIGDVFGWLTVLGALLLALAQSARRLRSRLAARNA